MNNLPRFIGTHFAISRIINKLYIGIIQSTIFKAFI